MVEIEGSVAKRPEMINGVTSNVSRMEKLDYDEIERAARADGV